MSFLTIATPAAVNFANVARPLIGLGFLGTLVLVFEPLLKGLLHAAMLLFKPRQSLAERKASTNLHSMQTIDSMALECENTDPDFSTELRALASRG
jgi:hypothetical protein